MTNQIIGESGTVLIPGNRGRATLQCVWSIERIDEQLGRRLDINSAWRDPLVQEQLYRAYLRDPANNPIALPPEQSVHCAGQAIDTDDGYNASVVALLNSNGWYQTVYRWENGKKVLKEPWHFEYFSNKDTHFGQLAGDDEDMTPDQDARLKSIEGMLRVGTANYGYPQATKQDTEDIRNRIYVKDGNGNILWDVFQEMRNTLTAISNRLSAIENKVN